MRRDQVEAALTRMAEARDEKRTRRAELTPSPEQLQRQMAESREASAHRALHDAQCPQRKVSIPCRNQRHDYLTSPTCKSSNAPRGAENSQGLSQSGGVGAGSYSGGV